MDKKIRWLNLAFSVLCTHIPLSAHSSSSVLILPPCPYAYNISFHKTRDKPCFVLQHARVAIIPGTEELGYRILQTFTSTSLPHSTVIMATVFMLGLAGIGSSTLNLSINLTKSKELEYYVDRMMLNRRIDATKSQMQHAYAELEEKIRKVQAIAAAAAARANNAYKEYQSILQHSREATGIEELTLAMETCAHTIARETNNADAAAAAIMAAAQRLSEFARYTGSPESAETMLIAEWKQMYQAFIILTKTTETVVLEAEKAEKILYILKSSPIT